MNFSMTRGDSVSWAGTATLSSSPYDLTGILGMSFTAKNKTTDTDANAVFKKTIGDGITVTSAAQGLFTVAILPADTASVSKVKTILVWDLEVVDSGGNVYTLNSGNLVINPDVTSS
jgi:hypothetical protein